MVLPSTQWAEENGTMTNLEGRVQLRRKAVEPPEGVRSDLEIIQELALRMGHTWPAEPREVFDELRRASQGGTADYSGITYERDGLFLALPHPGAPGTPRMFLDRFHTPDGLARFVPVTHRRPRRRPTPTSRLPHHRQGPGPLPVGARDPQDRPAGRGLARAVRRAPPRPRRAPEHRRGRSRARQQPQGATEGVARISEAIRSDTVFMPFHWEGANRLTNPALDPTSRMPEFKVCAVRLEKVA
ncbi:hypothetical protein GCM10020219_063850 [Nonomuraea dietziae]